MQKTVVAIVMIFCGLVGLLLSACGVLLLATGLTSSRLMGELRGVVYLIVGLAIIFGAWKAIDRAFRADRPPENPE